jgi:hypothetical protein
MKPRYYFPPINQPTDSEEPEKVHEMIKRTLLIALQTSVALAAKTFGGELLFLCCILVLYLGCGTTIFRHTI